MAQTRPMTVIAGVDVGNATTEVVLVSGGKILGHRYAVALGLALDPRTVP